MEHLGALILVLMCVIYLPLTAAFASFQQCSDENCFNCNTGSYRCEAAARCVPAEGVCDGQPDCPHGEDEQQCAEKRKTRACSRSEFTCGNGNCVPLSWRCDHSEDCADGSDERSCYLNECALNNGGCSHMCLDLPSGFMCDCPSGMRLVHDTQCEDVDHCLDSDVCDQICIYSNESLACECQDGYNLNPGTGECKATGGVAHMVVYTREGVKWMDLSGSEEKNFTTQEGSPGPIAVHETNNTLFWASPEDDVIYRMSVDSSDHRPSVFITASPGIVGLSVDGIHQLLYWVSTSTHGLHVASLNGSDQRQLISGLSRPTAVAVQPQLGHLFWADSGMSPSIERASQEGHHRISLVSSSIRIPVAVSLDVPRGLLYWADSGLHTISRVTFDGRHRKTVVESNGYLDRPFGLAVFESRVYWSDQLTKSTCSANKHNGKTLQVSQRPGSVLPAGLAVFRPPLQPADKDLPQSETRTLLSDSPFAWIVTLTVFLSVLLVGVALCWQRSELRVPHSLPVYGHVSLKESQDPLLLAGPPLVHEHKVRDPPQTALPLNSQNDI